MYYFLNDNMQAQKSGIEHAEIKRLQLFKHFKVPAQIVTRQFALDLHQVMAQAKIADAELVNLFDFFTGARQANVTPQRLKDLKLTKDHRLVADDKQTVAIMAQGQRRATVTLRHVKHQTLDHIQYFEPNGQTTKMVWYDTRGFLSLEQYFDWGGKIVREQYLGPDHRVHLVRLRYLNRQNEECESWRLLHYQGHDYEFAGFNELTRFFLDELNRRTAGQHVMICDRTVEYGWALFNMRTRVFKVLHLHNDHVNDPSDMLHSSFNSNYAHALNNLDQWQAVVAATPQQTQDMIDRFGTTPPEYTIPVGIVSDATLTARHQDWDARESQLIVQVARLAPEKQPDQAVKAFQIVHERYPQAHLEFWGYSNGDTETQLRQQVAAAGLQDFVLFKGYTEDVNQVYNRAQIGILPSRAEGFSLMLLEAQAHGLPMIANDIKYGPAAIIQDGKTGILTQNDDIQGLAQAMIDLLSNPAQLRNFSEAAYESSERYSEAAVMTQWQGLIQQAQQFYQASAKEG